MSKIYPFCIFGDPFPGSHKYWSITTCLGDREQLVTNYNQTWLFALPWSQRMKLGVLHWISCQNPYPCPPQIFVLLNTSKYFACICNLHTSGSSHKLFCTSLPILGSPIFASWTSYRQNHWHNWADCLQTNICTM